MPPILLCTLAWLACCAVWKPLKLPTHGRTLALTNSACGTPKAQQLLPPAYKLTRTPTYLNLPLNLGWGKKWGKAKEARVEEQTAYSVFVLILMVIVSSLQTIIPSTLLYLPINHTPQGWAFAVIPSLPSANNNQAQCSLSHYPYSVLASVLIIILPMGLAWLIVS